MERQTCTNALICCLQKVYAQYKVVKNNPKQPKQEILDPSCLKQKSPKYVYLYSILPPNATQLESPAAYDVRHFWPLLSHLATGSLIGLVGFLDKAQCFLGDVVIRGSLMVSCRSLLSSLVGFQVVKDDTWFLILIDFLLWATFTKPLTKANRKHTKSLPIKNVHRKPPQVTTETFPNALDPLDRLASAASVSAVANGQWDASACAVAVNL